MKLIRTIVFLNLVILSQALCAQDFVYEPINSAFGGNSYNYQWLLSSAAAQNTIEQEGSGSRNARDPLSDFEDGLNRKILSELSRNLVSSQFGENGLVEGSYTIGDFMINISEGDNGIEVIILDESTGNQTTVIIPYF